MEKNLFPYFHFGEFMDKTKRVMKYLTLFLLLFTFYSYSDSYAQKTKLKLDLEDATLLKMIQGIERQSEFVFMYSDDLLPALSNQQGDIKFKNETINSILERYFKNESLSYYLNNRQVVLRKTISKRPSRNNPPY